MFSVISISILLSLSGLAESGPQRVSQPADYQAEEQRLALQIITTEQLELPAGSGAAAASGAANGNLMAKASGEPPISFDDQYELLARQLNSNAPNDDPNPNHNAPPPRRIVINLKANGSDSGAGTRLTIGFAQPEASKAPVADREAGSKQQVQQPVRASFQQAVRPAASSTARPLASSRQRQMREALLEAVDRNGGVPAMLVPEAGELPVDNSNENRKPKLMLGSEAVDQMKRGARIAASQNKSPNLDSRFYGRPSTQLGLFDRELGGKNSKFEEQAANKRAAAGQRQPAFSHKSLSVDNNGAGNENYDGRRRRFAGSGNSRSLEMGPVANLENSEPQKESNAINGIDMSNSGPDSLDLNGGANNSNRRRKSAASAVAKQEQQVAERVARLMEQLKLYTTKEQLMRVARELEANNGPATDSSLAEGDDGGQANELGSGANLELLSEGGRPVRRARQESTSSALNNRPVYQLADQTELAAARNRVPAPLPYYEQLADSLETSASQSSPVDEPEVGGGESPERQQANGRQVLGEFKHRQLSLRDKLGADKLAEEEDDNSPIEFAESSEAQRPTGSGSDDEYTSNSDLVRVMQNNERLYNEPEEEEAAAGESGEDEPTGSRDPAVGAADDEIRAMEQIIDELVERERAEQAAASAATNQHAAARPDLHGSSSEPSLKFRRAKQPDDDDRGDGGRVAAGTPAS